MSFQNAVLLGHHSTPLYSIPFQYSTSGRNSIEYRVPWIEFCLAQAIVKSSDFFIDAMEWSIIQIQYNLVKPYLHFLFLRHVHLAFNEPEPKEHYFIQSS